MKLAFLGLLAILLALGAYALIANASEPLKVGDTAPDFTLKDQDGKSHKLSDYKGKLVILQFYPADKTPGCTLQARSLRDYKERIEARNAKLFGISVQDEKSKKQFCEEEKLTQTLLADTGKEVSKAFGVLNPVGVSNRVTFIIDEQGKIAQVMDKVDVRNHGEEILNLLEKLRPGNAPAQPKKAIKKMNDLKAYHDKNRLLLVFASGKEDKKLLAQRKDHNAHLSGFKERDLLVIELFEDNTCDTLTVEAVKALRKEHKLKKGEFKAVLIGKDGGAKLTSPDPLLADKLFSTIDAMPMRQHEKQDQTQSGGEEPVPSPS